MRHKTAIAFIVLASAFLVLIVFGLGNDPHAFKECSSCHLLPNPSGSSSGVRDMTRPITYLCSECHAKTLSEGYMHPVDVQPQNVIIPSDMPLSRSGEITCATCHDIHAEYYTPYGVPTHFLRRQESGKTFCKICHGDLQSLSQGHSASLGEAHFRSQYIATDTRGELDPMSRNCVSCHDGTYAQSVSIRAGTWTHGSSFMQHDRGGSHPVGIDYESVRIKRGRKTDLRPITEVDRRVRFFNGKVGCGSCHDPYSTIPKQLVMSDVNSKLCFTCHIV